jgi:toxin ParE1/3/4
MAQVLFTPLAEQDIKEIYLYLIEIAGQDLANKFLIDIRDKCLLFSNNPLLGKLRNEFIVNLRSFPFKKYVIFYIPIDKGIDVLRIIHSSRDIEQVFEEMLPLEP